MKRAMTALAVAILVPATVVAYDPLPRAGSTTVEQRVADLETEVNRLHGQVCSHHPDDLECDETPPDTTITAGPDASTEETSATFSFESEAGATFECKLDAGNYSPCTSPHTISDVAVGEHSLSVRAKDAAGNVDPTPAERAWEVTAPPPPNLKPDMGGSVWEPTRATEWAAFEGAMGPSEARRCFEDAIPATFAASCGGENGDVAAGRETWISFKPPIYDDADGPTGPGTTGGLAATAINQLKAYARSVPAGHKVVYSIWHEPENDLAGTQFGGSDMIDRRNNWLSAQRQAGAAIDEVDAERGGLGEFRYASILMGYWTFDTRGYGGVPGSITSAQGWRTLTAADWVNVDIIGFDPYKIKPTDPSMQNLMTRDNSGSGAGTSESAMANAVSWGKLIAFPEWGCTRTNFSDAQRAQWITDSYNWSKSWNEANPNNRLIAKLYFHIDNFSEGTNPSEPRATWEVVGHPLSEAALAAAFSDSRTP